MVMKQSTSARALQERGIRPAQRTRCQRRSSVAAAELHAYTTIFMVKMGGKPTEVIASVVHCRFSRMFYVSLSPTSNPSERRRMTQSLCAQARSLLAGLLSRVWAFARALRTFHDRSGQA